MSEKQHMTGFGLVGEHEEYRVQMEVSWPCDRPVPVETLQQVLVELIAQAYQEMDKRTVSMN